MGSCASLDSGSPHLTPNSVSRDYSSGSLSGPISHNNNSSAGVSSDTPARVKSSLKMSCETCSVHFSLFKRKKCCHGCRRYFCSTCMPKPSDPNTLRQCKKCQLLVSGHFSREDLQGWKIKDMRCFLQNRNISTNECREKHDLIELLLAQFCTRPRPSIQNQAQHQDLVRRMAAHVRDVNASSSSQRAPGEDERVPNQSSTDTAATESASSTSNNSQRPGSSSTEGGDRLRDLLETMERLQDMLTGQLGEEQEEDRTSESSPREAIRRTQLDDVNTEADIDNLTVRQLKELLVNNFVDYKGCFEKAELVQRVKRLWRDNNINKQRAEELHREDAAGMHGIPNPVNPSTTSSPSKSANSENLCEANEATTTSKTDSTTEAAPNQSISSPSNVDDDESSKANANPTSSDTQASDIAPEETTPLPKAAPAVESSNSPAVGTRQDDLCHICMDNLVDCILLECGHMVTCTLCGKRLADCPICRQYIVRVVRVFRS